METTISFTLAKFLNQVGSETYKKLTKNVEMVYITNSVGLHKIGELISKKDVQEGEQFVIAANIFEAHVWVLIDLKINIVINAGLNGYRFSLEDVYSDNEDAIYYVDTRRYYDYNECMERAIFDVISELKHLL